MVLLIWTVQYAVENFEKHVYMGSKSINRMFQDKENIH